MTIPDSRNSSRRFGNSKVREASREKHAQAAIPPLRRGISSHAAASAERQQQSTSPHLPSSPCTSQAERASASALRASLPGFMGLQQADEGVWSKLCCMLSTWTILWGMSG